ncbi:MAG: sulfite exporter TauE/SafE family protein [Acidobacteria bacterium]|nr:sulfite exporter TauE/SafE family protein [Acidobacteriota bacterium]
MPSPSGRLWAIFAIACGVGVMGGMFGVGGGILLVPLLVLVFHFEQHKAQGTSLVALVPPTGLLAVLNYWRADYVDWRVGLLLMPGVFLGGMAGSRLAQKLSPRKMRLVFATLLFLVGALHTARAMSLL